MASCVPRRMRRAKRDNQRLSGGLGGGSRRGLPAGLSDWPRCTGGDKHQSRQRFGSPKTGPGNRADFRRRRGIAPRSAGRIFHRVLDTARYDGSFYTSTAAAVLLASLAMREQDADWTDPKAVADLRICDPACGTGTLLMAAAERIRDLRNAAGKGRPGR